MGIAQVNAAIVGERARMAMQVGSDSFPTWAAVISVGMPGKLGLYLALTGVHIGAADALYSGLADVYLPPAAIASLSDSMAQLRWSQVHAADVQRCIHEYARPYGALAAPLATLRASIDTHFAHATVSAILSALEQETRTEHAEWAHQTAKLMRSRSPTMLA